MSHVQWLGGHCAVPAGRATAGSPQKAHLCKDGVFVGEQGQLLRLIGLALDAGVLDRLAVSPLELKLYGGIVHDAHIAQKVFLQASPGLDEDLGQQ